MTGLKVYCHFESIKKSIYLEILILRLAFANDVPFNTPVIPQIMWNLGKIKLIPKLSLEFSNISNDGNCVAFARSDIEWLN